jgi:hypothetical protein
VRLRVVVLSAIFCGCATPPYEGASRGPAPSSASGSATATGGSAVRSARTSAYTGLAAAALAPLAAIAEERNKPRPEQPAFTADDKVFLRRATIDLGDFSVEGTRRVVVTCLWENAKGETEEEAREGEVHTVDGERRFTWVNEP